MAETPRANATRLEERIREHVETAAEWADRASGRVAPRPCQRDSVDNAHAFASIAQAHAAAAQALALLRRPHGPETR